MRTLSALLTLLILGQSSGCAHQTMSYASALKLSEKMTGDSKTMDWLANHFLKPFTQIGAEISGQCYTKGSPLPEPTEMVLYVNPNGVVDQVYLKERTEFALCFSKRIQGTRVPPPPNEIYIRVPFDFSRKEA